MKVAIIIGSESDLPIVKKAATILKKFGVKYSLRVMSAHRTPDIAAEFAKNAEANGYEVVIAAAGKAAHLPGVLAAFTVLPVIGIPIKAAAFDGMDALLAIVQMPAGIPVATVAVDGAENAALLAVRQARVREGGRAACGNSARRAGVPAFRPRRPAHLRLRHGERHVRGLPRKHAGGSPGRQQPLVLCRRPAGNSVLSARSRFAR